MSMSKCGALDMVRSVTAIGSDGAGPVIAGPDPAIHPLSKKVLLAKKMDLRVKPAGDACGDLNQTNWKLL